jgi:hypothetical protein
MRNAYHVTSFAAMQKPTVISPSSYTVSLWWFTCCQLVILLSDIMPITYLQTIGEILLHLLLRSARQPDNSKLRLGVIPDCGVVKGEGNISSNNVGIRVQTLLQSSDQWESLEISNVLTRSLKWYACTVNFLRCSPICHVAVMSHLPSAP